MSKKRGRYTQKSQAQETVVLQGTKVRVGEGDRAFDKAMRIFSRKVTDAGILREVRDREFFEKPTAKRKRLKAAAVRRWQRKLQEMNNPQYDMEE